MHLCIGALFLVFPHPSSPSFKHLSPGFFQLSPHPTTPFPRRTSLSDIDFPVPEMRVACRLAPPPSRPDCPPLLLTGASNRHAGLSGGLQPIINIGVVVEREDLVTVKVRAEAHKFVSAGRSLHPLRVRNCWTSSIASTLRTIPICLSRSNARSGTPTRPSAVWTAGAARQAPQPTSRKISLAQRREGLLLDDRLDRREELLRTRTDNVPPRNVDKRRSPRLKDAPRLLDKRVDRKPVRVAAQHAATR